MKKTYKVSATIYSFIEADSREDAIAEFEDTGMEDITMDTDTLRARPIKINTI